jgi:hypothetical protein
LTSTVGVLEHGVGGDTPHESYESFHGLVVVAEGGAQQPSSLILRPVPVHSPEVFDKPEGRVHVREGQALAVIRPSDVRLPVGH